jgi:hypothetical protein
MPLFNTKSLVLCSAILSGLWLTACKTTPTPSQPAAQIPQSQKPAETRQPSASESTPSAQPAAPEKSKSESAVSSAAPAPNGPDTEVKPPADQTASPATGAGQPKPADQNPAVDQTPTSPSAESRLAKARDDLRISQATEKRIASQLEQLKSSPNASAEEIRNYGTYLESVQAMVAENRQTVAKMEAAYAERSAGKKSAETSAADQLEKLSNPSIPEENVPNRVAELDRQLSASLNEFDAVLLKKMENIQSESAAKMHDLAQQAAEAAKHLKEKGAESATDKSTASAEGSKSGEKNGQSQSGAESKNAGTEDAKNPSANQKSSQTEQSEGDTTVAAGGPGPQHPSTRYRKEDDDIVARQLREAAEKETDPELKEKLWKEYEAYRKNTQP